MIAGAVVFVELARAKGVGVIERRLTSVAVSDILRVFVRCVCVIAEARLGSGPRWDLKEACAAKDDEVTREEVDKELEDIDEDKSAKIRAYIEQLEARVETLEGDKFFSFY